MSDLVGTQIVGFLMHRLISPLKQHGQSVPNFIWKKRIEATGINTKFKIPTWSSGGNERTAQKKKKNVPTHEEQDD